MVEDLYETDGMPFPKPALVERSAHTWDYVGHSLIMHIVGLRMHVIH